MAPTHHHFRLAILEADTPFHEINVQYGGYRGVFTHLLRRALSPQPLESTLTLTGHDVVNDLTSYPPLDAIDGLLITGSKHNAFDNDQWILKLVDFVQQALAHEPPIRVVGVCFGHQIVARALGRPVVRKEWEVSVVPTRLTETGRKVFGAEADVLNIQQMHRDQVDGVPEGAELLASTEHCANHGFLLPGRAITVQGHPEFTEGIMKVILNARHATGLFTDDMFLSGMERNGDHHDGIAVGKTFVRFLLGEDLV